LSLTRNNVPVSGQVIYHPAVRFAKKKCVLVKGTNQYSEIKITLGESDTQMGLDDFNNRTDFYFGGDDESRYIFRNLIFTPNIDIGAGLELSDDLLLMKIGHHSKITFLNCSFQLDTKTYHVQVFHDAVCELFGCLIPDNLVFDTTNNGKIQIC
jgi:hypothetical protein